MSDFAARPIFNEGIHALFVVTALVALLGIAEWWHRRRQPPVEWTRKLVHFGAGTIAMPLPWMFGSVGSVLALGVGVGLLLRLIRGAGFLRSLHGVARQSDGDLYYLAAILLLFPVGRHRPLLYLVPLLVLVLSDTLAALVGEAYGRWSFPVGAGRRSAEGSAAFFVATCVCVYLPLQLAGSSEQLAAGLIAVQIALLATSLEAISPRGSDNLIVPVATSYLLAMLIPYPAAKLVLLILSELFVLGITTLLARRFRLVSVRGVVTAHLFLFSALAAAGFGSGFGAG